MVDAASRTRAAEAIQRFRDGAITNMEFEGLWPCYDRRDRGLRAIETMLWRFYDDFREHKLAEDYELTPEGRRLFDRCILFLRTELEYSWADDDFIGTRSHAGLTLLGLSESNWEDVRLKHLHIVGDDPFWPFFSRREYEDYRDAGDAP
jgi:hypothetical protein